MGICDFLAEANAIQVCAQLTADNRERELSGVLQACRLPGKRRPLILTLNQRQNLAEQGTSVAVRPLWEWLLGD